MNIISKKIINFSRPSANRIPILFTAAIGILITFAVFQQTSTNNRRLFELDFREWAGSRASVLAELVLHNLEAVDGLRRFYEGSTYVDRNEFRKFALPVFNYPGLRWLEWVPRIRRSELNEFVERLSADGGEESLNAVRAVTGKFAGDPSLDELFPVIYIEPFHSNNELVGFDFASNPVLRQGLDSATGEGVVKTAGPVRAHGKDSLYYLIEPVYQSGNTHSGKNGRNSIPSGFVVGAVSPGGLIEGAFERAPAAGLAIQIADVLPSGSQIIYRQDPEQGSVDWQNPLLRHETDIKVADRTWRVTIVPGSFFVASRLSRGAWNVFPAGFLLTALSCLYLNALVEKRSQAERIIRERAIEERFRKAFMLSPVATCITSFSNFRILEANPAFENLLGYSRGEMLRHSDLEIGVWVDCSTRNDVLKNLSDGKPVRDLETAFRSRKGRLVPVRYSAQVIELAGELCFLSLLVDLTAQKETDEALKRRNRELTLLGRLMAAAAVEKNSSALLEIACREMASAFELPLASASLANEERSAVTVAAEFDSTGCQSILGLEIPVAGNALIKELLDTGKPVLITDAPNDPRLKLFAEILRRRGAVSLLAIPLADQGTIFGCVVLASTQSRSFDDNDIALASNVTGQLARSLAMIRLDETRRRLLTAIEQTPESIVITDIQGNIRYVNPAFEHTTGYTSAEAIGKNPRILKSGRHDAAFYKRMWKSISSGNIWQGTINNLRKDGRLYTESAIICPVRDHRGEIVNYIAVKRDITRELEMEEQLRQAQKMESIGRLAGGVAHDFNNLLSPILGYAEMLLMDLSPSDANFEPLWQIRRAGERARDLTQQLLAFGRKQTLALEPVDLRLVITGFKALLRRTLREDVRIELKIPEELGVVRADIGQIEQVLMNLSINAQDAMPSGGVLTVELSDASPAQFPGGSHAGTAPVPYVLLSVQDTGHGMDDSTLEHIFEPFFTTKEKGKGTGLGLSMIYGIVKQHGGNILVDSIYGKGTTFKIYLPVSGDSIDIKHPVPHEIVGMPRGHETIMLVEDNDGVRALARRVLEGLGYRVMAAISADDCLNNLAAHTKIDLLLTDVVMPGLNGRELFERLILKRPDLKVIYMSGYSDDVIAYRGILEVSGAFIQKPFTIQTLATKVREELDRPQTEIVS